MKMAHRAVKIINTNKCMMSIKITKKHLETYDCEECWRLYRLFYDKSIPPKEGEDAILYMDPLWPHGIYEKRVFLWATELLRHTCPMKLFLKALLLNVLKDEIKHLFKKISVT